MVPGGVYEVNENYYFVYGVAPNDYGVFNVTEGIGVNLLTSEVETVSAYATEVRQPLAVLDKEMLKTLQKHIDYWLKLKQQTLVITGKARSGKDTIASEICATTFGCITHSLGTPIKEIHRILYGTKKGKDRKNLIKIGQRERQNDTHIWIKVWLRRAIDEIKTYGNTYFVVADVRQPNEYSFFKSMGIPVIKVVADEEKRLEKIRELDGEEGLEEDLLNDETETYIGTFDADVTLVNNYDDKLFQDIKEVIETLRSNR